MIKFIVEKMTCDATASAWENPRSPPPPSRSRMPTAIAFERKVRQDDVRIIDVSPTPSCLVPSRALPEPNATYINRLMMLW